MTQMAASPHAAGHQVRGLIITGLADPQLQRYATRLATAEGFQLDWLVYEVAMTVTPADPTSRDLPGEADEAEPFTPRLLDPTAGPDVDPDAEAIAWCLEEGLVQLDGDGEWVLPEDAT